MDLPFIAFYVALLIYASRWQRNVRPTGGSPCCGDSVPRDCRLTLSIVYVVSIAKFALLGFTALFLRIGCPARLRHIQHVAPERKPNVILPEELA